MKPWTLPQQEHTSAATSLVQLAAIFNLVGAIDGWKPGSVNADLGGGRCDLATDWLALRGVQNVIYDPFNRSPEHNTDAMLRLRGGQAHTATVSNVLNVIAEPEVRQAVIATARDAVGIGGTAYFTVYEGNGSGVTGPSTKGWQENRKVDTYLGEIGELFSSVSRKGRLILAHP